MEPHAPLLTAATDAVTGIVDKLLTMLIASAMERSVCAGGGGRFRLPAQPLADRARPQLRHRQAPAATRGR
jgi:hypothetical protein